VPLLLLTFALLPFAELYLLIRIGRVAGPLPTLALVIVTGIVGAALAKRQGQKVLLEWREALASGRVPEEGVVGGILVLVGGLLLITPGVLTDVLGVFCLVPVTRRLLAASLTRYLSAKVAHGQARAQAQVHSYGFQWPPAPSSEGPGPRVGQMPRARKPHAAPRPFRRDDVIDTEGEEV
jgi:UPF0716 protein FxsA